MCALVCEGQGSNQLPQNVSWLQTTTGFRDLVVEGEEVKFQHALAEQEGRREGRREGELEGPGGR
eukprot:2633337-Rhodomonas_salina.6